MKPTVVMAAEEPDRELTHLVISLLDVIRDVTRVANLGGPPKREEMLKMYGREWITISSFSSLLTFFVFFFMKVQQFQGGKLKTF